MIPGFAFFFDFDGTMYDPGLDHERALSAAILIETGQLVHPEALAYLGPITTRAKLHRLSIPSQFDGAIVSRKKKIYLGIIEDKKIDPYPDFVVDLLEEVYPPYVVTNSSAGNVWPVLIKLGVRRSIRGVIDTHQYCLPGKPAPDLYLKALEMLRNFVVFNGFSAKNKGTGLTPVIFEDSDVGLRAAKAVPGAMVVPVSNANEFPEILKKVVEQCRAISRVSSSLPPVVVPVSSKTDM